MGFINSQMATEFEVDPAAITYWMRELGLTRNQSLKHNGFNKQAALKLYYQGFNDRQIAKTLKIHFNTANRWRTKQGLQPNEHVILTKKIGRLTIRSHARDKIELMPSILA